MLTHSGVISDVRPIPEQVQNNWKHIISINESTNLAMSEILFRTRFTDFLLISLRITRAASATKWNLLWNWNERKFVFHIPLNGFKGALSALSACIKHLSEMVKSKLNSIKRHELSGFHGQSFLLRINSLQSFWWHLQYNFCSNFNSSKSSRAVAPSEIKSFISLDSHVNSHLKVNGRSIPKIKKLETKSMWR